MRRLLLLLPLAIVSLPASASAQVNVEPLRKKLNEDGYSGSIEASATIRTGNVEGTVASGVGQIGWANRSNLFFLAARGDYSHLDDSLQLGRTFFHARYNLTLARTDKDKGWAFMELFAQEQTDALVLLRNRELLGIGPRFAFITDKIRTIVIGVSAMLEHEVIHPPEGAPDDPETLFVRASSYLGATFTPDSRITYSFTGLYQPRVNDFGDYRILIETLLDVAIGKGFSVRLTGTLRYDSQPVTGLKKTDVEVRNAIAWSW